MADSVMDAGAVVGVDVPATPDDLLLADWLLWATPSVQLDGGGRRYYCRQLTTRRVTQTYADPDQAVAVVRRWIRIYTKGTVDHVG